MHIMLISLIIYAYYVNLINCIRFKYFNPIMSSYLI